MTTPTSSLAPSPSRSCASLPHPSLSSSSITDPVDLPSTPHTTALTAPHPKLPQELLEAIITQVSFTTDTRTLLTCAHLSRSLVPCARFRLFHPDRPSSASLRTFSLLHCKKRDLSDVDAVIELLRSPLCTFTRVICELGLTIAGITSTMGTRLLRNQIPYDPRDVNRLFGVLDALLLRDSDEDWEGKSSELQMPQRALDGLGGGLGGRGAIASRGGERECVGSGPGRIELKRLVIENLEWGDLTSEAEDIIKRAADRVTEGLNLKQVWFESRTILGGENPGGTSATTETGPGRVDNGERKVLEVLSWFSNVKWVKWSDLNAYWYGALQQFFHNLAAGPNHELPHDAPHEGGDAASRGPGGGGTGNPLVTLGDDERSLEPLPNLQTFLISATSLHSPFTRAFAHNLACGIKSLVVIQNQTQLISLSHVNEYLVTLGPVLEEITYDLSAFVSFARQIGYGNKAKTGGGEDSDEGDTSRVRQANHIGSRNHGPRVHLDLHPLTGLTTLSFGRIQILPDPIWQILPKTYNEAVNPCRLLSTVKSPRVTTIEFNLEFIPHPLGSPEWDEEEEGENDLVDKIGEWMRGFGWREIDQAVRACPGFSDSLMNNSASSEPAGSSCPVKPTAAGSERRCVRIGLFPGRYADVEGCMVGVEKLIREEMPWCDGMGYLSFEVGKRYRTVCDRGPGDLAGR